MNIQFVDFYKNFVTIEALEQSKQFSENHRKYGNKIKTNKQTKEFAGNYRKLQKHACSQ